VSRCLKKTSIVSSSPGGATISRNSAKTQALTRAISSNGGTRAESEAEGGRLSEPGGQCKISKLSFIRDAKQEASKCGKLREVGSPMRSSRVTDRGPATGCYNDSTDERASEWDKSPQRLRKRP